jgi:hypothetical protein
MPASLQAAYADLAGATTLPGHDLDVRCGPWPIRNQQQRGTCVSFAAAACREQLFCPAGPDGPPDLSEQFLYWAIKEKVGDHWPNDDGTLLEFARDALAAYGICPEATWRYNPTPIVGTPGQGPAPAGAEAAALPLTCRGVYHGQPGTGAAALAFQLLAQGRAVGISLPVFADPVSQVTNWTTQLGWSYGKVIDPPPTSHVDGGHAVALVGFRPDPIEPLGGHFVFRNSWGTGWGSSLPSPRYAAPAPGYGQISASYVERYTWELLQLLP